MGRTQPDRWPIGEVARLSGVTTRTLRHYDAVGLLRPAGTGPGGVRWYGHDELLRLQRILLLRELGVGLAVIARVLDRGGDPLEALREHRARLAGERARLRRLLATVDATIHSLEEGTAMDADQMFEGFDPERQERYERELVERYGDAAAERIAESRRRTSGWGRQEFADVDAAFREAEDRLVTLLRDGAAPDDPRAQDAVAHHYAVVSRFWTPDRESYAGLGALYVQHPDFRARYDAKDPGLAEYLSAAMTAYAESRLA